MDYIKIFYDYQTFLKSKNVKTKDLKIFLFSKFLDIFGVDTLSLNQVYHRPMHAGSIDLTLTFMNRIFDI